jgi:hypothetical protein
LLDRLIAIDPGARGDRLVLADLNGGKNRIHATAWPRLARGQEDVIVHWQIGDEIFAPYRLAQPLSVRRHVDEIVDRFCGAWAIVRLSHADTPRNALRAVFRISRCGNPDRAAASISSAIASSRPII